MQRSGSRWRSVFTARAVVCCLGCCLLSGFGAGVARGAAVQQRPAASARQLYSDGKALLKAQHFAEAADALRQATERARLEGLLPDEQGLMFYVLGLAYVRAERDDDAVAALKRSLALNPDDAECRLELAQIALRQRDYALAIEQGEAALRIGLLEAADRNAAQTIVAQAETRRLYHEGRDLLKAHKRDAAAEKLRQAVAKARAATLSADEQSLCHYLLGLALSHGRHDDQAAAAFRAALQLSPNDAEARLELAQVLLRQDRFDDAQRESEQALHLGLADQDDKRDAAALIKLARTEHLRERFSAYVGISYGYDSNVLQGRFAETIAGTPTIGSSIGRSASAVQGTSIDPATRTERLQDYVSTIASFYKQPTPSSAEADLPLTLNLDLSGRIFAARKTEIWLGLRYYGYFMTSPRYLNNPLAICYSDATKTTEIDCPPNHDIYNIQEITLPIRFNWSPKTWLRLGAELNGFINSNGANKNTIEAYQGGFQGILDAVFIESSKWRTKLNYSHQLRRSFDRIDDVYLDGDRDQVKLVQELRLAFRRVALRSQFGYRFRSERTGILSIDSGAMSLPLTATVIETIGTRTYTYDGTLGYYGYSAPLSYIGNEISLRTKLSVPWSFDINFGLSYEPRIYDGKYQGTYQFERIYAEEDANRSIPGRLMNDQMVTKQTDLALAALALQRRDHLVTADVALTKRLPHGFSLELAYIFYFNKSNITNAVDNRNYMKHTLNFTAAYSF